jgi:hypothetical protein
MKSTAALSWRAYATGGSGRCGRPRTSGAHVLRHADRPPAKSRFGASQSRTTRETFAMGQHSMSESARQGARE